MLQSIGAYSPWSSGAASGAGGDVSGSSHKKSRRTRRKAQKQFGSLSSLPPDSAATSPTPAMGALTAAHGEHRNLQYDFSYGAGGGGPGHDDEEWESGSDGGGSGSDVEDPLTSARSNNSNGPSSAGSGTGWFSGSNSGRSSGTRRASHLRSGHDGALYGHVWCTGDGRSPDQPTNVLESAGFVAGSTLLNIILLIFLLWTHASPRCADVWFPTTPHVTSLASVSDRAAAPTLPSVRIVDDESAVPAYRSEVPQPVAMPALVDFDPLPKLVLTPPPAKDQGFPAAAAPISKTQEIKPTANADPDEENTDVAPNMSPEMQQRMQQQKEMQDLEDAEKKKGSATDAPQASATKPVVTPTAPVKPNEKAKDEAAAAPPAAASKPADAAAEGASSNVAVAKKHHKDADSPPNPFPDQVATSADVDAVDRFQRDFDVSRSHRLQWQACDKALVPPPGTQDASQSLVGAPPQKFCPETSTNEQYFQLEWFGSHVVSHGANAANARRFVPKFLSCVHLPPEDYTWPDKYPALPYNGGREGAGAVHWPNLRVSSREELVEFNRGTPKNLFHFDAHVYDQDGLEEMSLAARYIPLAQKVRLALDLGAGGGSFGVLLKRKYDITTVASAFADWPYCEYMTERGELCLLVDVMEAMPFAQRSFDLIHVSWVYHGQTPMELWDFVHEVDRVLRPGGYLYLRGGWSNSQIIAQRSMYANLGYTVLYEQVSQKPSEVTDKVSFGPDLPYNADWTAILLKPISAAPASEEGCAARLAREENGKVKLPLTARKTPTQEGNVLEE